MPPEPFCVGPAVDVLFPDQMNTDPFLPQEWIQPQPITHNALEFETPLANPGHRRPGPLDISQSQCHLGPFQRPKSSPSTFGPMGEFEFTDYLFNTKNDEFPSSFSSASLARSATTASPFDPTYASSASQSLSPPTRQSLVPIAPDPIGLQQMHAMKRIRDEEDLDGPKRRKRAQSQVTSTELNEEEQLLIKLKDEENLPWKDIAIRFQTDLGKSYQVPALQMRFKRLRERMRHWTETDIQALEQAYEYWEKSQFDIISAKMLEFGATERWPAKSCARKWDELHSGQVPFPVNPAFLSGPWPTPRTNSLDSTIS